jgi:hypothetical protein
VYGEWFTKCSSLIVSLFGVVTHCHLFSVSCGNELLPIKRWPKMYLMCKHDDIFQHINSNVRPFINSNYVFHSLYTTSGHPVRRIVVLLSVATRSYFNNPGFSICRWSDDYLYSHTLTTGGKILGRFIKRKSNHTPPSTVC